MSETGKPIVYLLHGLLGTGHGHFAPQITALRERYRLVPIDLPGHGRCALDAGPAYYDLATDYALALLARFGRGHLVGASYLGGLVAVRMVRRRADLVASLTITGLSPGLPADVITARAGAFEPLAESAPELAQQYEDLHGVRWRETVRQVAADLAERYPTELGVSGAMLGGLGVPVALLNGSLRADERSAAETAGEFGVRGAVIAGGGHLPGNDRPEEFNQLLIEFWTEHSDHVDLASA